MSLNTDVKNRPVRPKKTIVIKQLLNKRKKLKISSILLQGVFFLIVEDIASF